jgi:hypothetical protein
VSGDQPADPDCGLTSVQISAARGATAELPEGPELGTPEDGPLFDSYPEE